MATTSSLDVNRIVQRGIGVSKLVQNTYREIAVDAGATREAGFVVAIVALANAIGGSAHGLGGIIVGLIGAFVWWILFSVVAWYVGTTLFGNPVTRASQESLVRTLGYAQAPNVLAITGFIPLIGWIGPLVGGIWVLVTSVYAIRQVLGLSIGRTIITAVIAWIVAGIVFGIFAAITGIGYGIVNALTSPPRCFV
ncbi:MAG: YIP1 family protein [Thermomicrobiales bacterium]